MTIMGSIFYLFGICTLIATVAVMQVVRSNIQIVAAAGFGLYAIVTFGFGALISSINRSQSTHGQL